MQEGAPAPPREAKAREALWGFVTANAILVLAEDFLSIDGWAWSLLRLAVTVGFTVTGAVWLVGMLRRQPPGSFRAWAETLLIVTLVVLGLYLAGMLLAELLSI